MARKRKAPWERDRSHRNEAKYRVTYSGTQAFDTFKTKSAAEKQARHAVKTGNTQSCIDKMSPTGGYLRLKCVKRRKRK